MRLDPLAQPLRRIEPFAMKTERRHELQKNQLADALGSEIDYLRPYYKTIVAVLIAVAAIGATIAVIANQRSSNNAAAWGSFYDVVGDGNSDKMPAKFESVAKAYAGTQAALWADLSAADLKLQSGSTKMFSDRNEAEKELAQAKLLFETVLKNAGNEQMLRRRAHFGLAQTLEAMNNPEEAQTVFEQIAKDNPEDAFGKAATQRLTQIKRLNDSQWFAWFAEYKPVPPIDDPLHGRGPLGELPGSNDLNNDLQAPGIIGNELEEKMEESPIEFDAPKTTAPEEKKDDAPPATPAEAEAPQDEKKTEAPATEPPAETPAAEKKEDAPPAEEPKPEEKAAEPAPAPADEK